MSSGTVYCDADRFALTLNGMLDDMLQDVDGAAYRVVVDTTKLARNKVAKNARSYGWKRYPRGFRGTTTKKKLMSYGEVGNATEPGLVHLLEKGHAKVGGGRTRAFMHVAPAADESFEYFWDEMQEAVGAAL